MLISLLVRDKEQLSMRRYSLKKHLDGRKAIGHIKQLEFKDLLSRKTLKGGQGYNILVHGVLRFVVVCFKKLKSILYVS